MVYMVNTNHSCGIINLIDDAILTNANPIMSLISLNLTNTGRAWIC